MRKRNEKNENRKIVEFETEFGKCERKQSKFVFRGLKSKRQKNDHFFVFKYYKRKITLCQPIWLRFSNLKVSKLHMIGIYCLILQPFYYEANLNIPQKHIDFFIHSLKLKPRAMVGG